jgi:hypothetical protein
MHPDHRASVPNLAMLTSHSQMSVSDLKAKVRVYDQHMVEL